MTKISANDKIKFGVIGGNRGKDLISTFKLFPGLEVTAIMDIKRDVAQTCAPKLKGCSAHDNLESFAQSGIDVAIIASPVPFHVEQAIPLLKENIHVCSEVTAAPELDAAQRLVAAAAESKASYMMLENYRYLDEVELIKNLADAGKFGEIYFAEGAYLHDCKDLFFDVQGELTWRGCYNWGFYCTHTLGPLLYILGDRIKKISAIMKKAAIFNKQFKGHMNTLMQMETINGRHIFVRVDFSSPRPHQMEYYSLQGTHGAYEAYRGNGDKAKVWFESDHEPSNVHQGSKWHDLENYREEYLALRKTIPAQIKNFVSHGTSEYWMFKEYEENLRSGNPMTIDVHLALDYTLPGIIGRDSARLGGVELEVPDSRSWN